MKRFIVAISLGAIVYPAEAVLSFSWKKVKKSLYQEKEKVAGVFVAAVGVAVVALVSYRFQHGIPDGSPDDLQELYKDQLGVLAKVIQENSRASIDLNSLIALIDNGQNPNEQIGDATPLILACKAGDDVAAERLLELGASAQSVIIDEETDVYISPWFAALQLERARYYIGCGWAAYYNWHRHHRRPLLDRLLTNNVDISDCGGQGTALHEALKNRDKLLAAFLLERNITIEGMRDRNGHNAFEAACRRCGGKTT